MQNMSLPVKIFLPLIIIAVYIAGLTVKVMDVDAAQYAAMSHEMYTNHHYVNVEQRHEKYLDKPPLIFWMATLSYKLFGVSTVSYKLPTFLFILLGFYATFRLGRLLYNKETGLWAVLILSCCEAFFYFTNDVRTDANLTAAIIFAIWQIMEFLFTKKKRFFLGSVIGIALAMLAKGPIGLMVPVLAIGSYLLAKRDFKIFFNWYWLLGLFGVLLLLMPMVWGLYTQHGTPGVLFYFWTQSFGRITGQNVWKDDSGYFFFVHTFLWAFLPWMFLAYFGAGKEILRFVKDKFPKTSANTMLLLGGIAFPFMALSSSHYKLPHYIFVFFPLVAILTAKTALEMVDNKESFKSYSIFRLTQFVIAILIWIFSLVCMTVFFPCTQVWIWIALIPLAFLTFYFFNKSQSALPRLILPSVFAMLGLNLMLNCHFFPQLLSYQGGSTVAEIVSKEHIPVSKFYSFGLQNASLDFYSKAIIPNLDSTQLDSIVLKNASSWVYTNESGFEIIRGKNYKTEILDTIHDIHVTKVTMPFLFYKTRPQHVNKQFLICIRNDLAIAKVE